MIWKHTPNGVAVNPCFLIPHLTSRPSYASCDARVNTSWKHPVDSHSGLLPSDDLAVSGDFIKLFQQTFNFFHTLKFYINFYFILHENKKTLNLSHKVIGVSDFKDLKGRVTDSEIRSQLTGASKWQNIFPDDQLKYRLYVERPLLPGSVTKTSWALWWCSYGDLVMIIRKLLF